ncbi:MAG TPA: hypothetical protein VK348_10820 [Planctomycetota bacterium]|nr:hypothetical protein [Planctomycetota bacterium]
MRIALATCRQLPAWEVDDRCLHAALAARAVEVAQPAWDDGTVDWRSFAAVLIRTTWDYQERREAFVAWAARAGAVTRLFNPAAVVAWNTHKSYLRDLGAAGVPLLPTVWLMRGDRPDVGALLRQHGWDAGFLKPCVGATARQTLRFQGDARGIASAQAHVEQLLPHEDLMLQPYLRTVERRGEWSAIFVAGELSHCVRKIPVPGDYRVQDDFGARDEPYVPTAAERQLAEHAAALLARAGGPCPGADGRPLLYARTDCLWLLDGSSVLSELEAVEPSLFFRHRPATGGLLADALLARLGRG